MKHILFYLLILTTIAIPTNYYSIPVESHDPIINNISSYKTKEYTWNFKYIGLGMTPLNQSELTSIKENYNAYYVGDVSKKVLYLTFDEGYENGYTSIILDILKKHNVKAAFFAVRPYIKTSPELIKRMVNEGHLVCNHSSHHPSMAKILDKEKFKNELSQVEDVYTEVTGLNMPKFFRPPMGKYSELSLALTKELGYKTIFWSFAYKDWLINDQPSAEFAKKRILERTHNGAIILLHAVSKTNVEILDEILTTWEREGYELKPLTELPN